LVDTCGAKKRNGDPCGAAPMKGQKRCARHGGKSPQAKKAAERRLAEQEATRKMEKAVRTLGITDKYQDVDPGKALLEEISVTYAHVQWLREKVGQLEEVEHLTKGTREDEWAEVDDESGNPGAHALVWGQTEYRNKVGGEDAGQTTVEQAGVSVWYQLYLKEREHLVKVTTAALKAGIEERKVRLAESQGELVARVIRGILEALNLTTDQWALVQTVVPRELRALAAE
jgi:hypothetical protein